MMMVLGTGIMSGFLAISAPCGMLAFGLNPLQFSPVATKSPTQAARYEHDQVHAMALLIPCPLDRPPHQRLGLAQRHGATTSRSRVRPRPSWASGMKPGGNADRGSREAAEAITGGTECDQCGDACGSSELAVCRSRGCGVKFAQCARCGTEYDGCCSDACQALVADPARNIMNNEGVTSPVGQRRRSELVSPDEAESWDKVVGSFGRRAGVPVDRTATVQPNAVETEDDRKRGGVGGVLSNGAVASARGPLNGARNEVATGFKAEKGEKTQKEEKVKEEEPVLESYASRHSAPESSCLAGVREATTREQPGGAHMVSGHLQGGLLKLLTGLCGAKRVLDIGTFTGYSALAFAEALPMDGVVVTLESDPRAAEAAKGHFDRSSHGGKVRVVLGQAMDSIDEVRPVADAISQCCSLINESARKRWTTVEYSCGLLGSVLTLATRWHDLQRHKRLAGRADACFRTTL